MNHCGAACPAERIPRHQSQQQRFRGNPPGQPPEARNVAQSLHALLQLEMAYVLLYDIGHGHAQGGREILHRHLLLLVRVLKKRKQAVGQSDSIARGIEIDG